MFVQVWLLTSTEGAEGVDALVTHSTLTLLLEGLLLEDVRLSLPHLFRQKNKEPLVGENLEKTFVPSHFVSSHVRDSEDCAFCLDVSM